MADPSEKNRSIDGCASSKGSGLFDCLLLPLFSLCSRRNDVGQTKITDLPLLPLLVICGYLRTNGCCKDLNNFRKSCRSFASAVNTFLECRQNLPEIKILMLDFESHKRCPRIRGGFNRHNYFIHPLLHYGGRDGSNLFNISRRSWDGNRHVWEDTHDTTFAIRRKTGTDSEDITQMQNIQEVLSGPVDKLALTFWEDDDNDIKMASEILQNMFSWNTLAVIVDAFNGAVSSFILELLRKRASWADGQVVVEAMHFIEETDSDLFLSALDSMANHVLLVQADAEKLFFGFPTGFWYQWLLQKIREGYSVRFNNFLSFSESPKSIAPLASDTYVLQQIQWCKSFN